MAEVDDRDLEANRERYEREVGGQAAARQVRAAAAHRAGHVRVVLNRIYIKVRPERVFVWPDGDLAKPARDATDAHMEEVRSGHSEEPLEPHEPPTGGAVAWDERIEQLGRRYPTAVLAWVAPDGFPLAARLPVSLDAEARRIALGAEPAGLPLAEGTRLPHRPRPRARLQLAGELPGPRRPGSRRQRLGARAPQARGRFRAPRTRAILARYRRNLGKSIRFNRTARRELRKRKA